MTPLSELAWEYSRLGDAIQALARDAGLEPLSDRVPEPAPMEPEALRGWVEAAAALLDLEAEFTPVEYARLRDWLRSAAPLLVRLPGPEPGRFLTVTRPGVVLTPALKRRRVGSEAIRAAMCEEMEAEARQRTGPVLDRAGLRGSERERAERALIEARLAPRWMGAFALGVPVTARWPRLLRQGPWRSKAVRLSALHAIRLLAFLLAWRVIGEAVLSGRLETGWLIAWALLLVTIAPLHMAASWLQARMAVAFGCLLKRRLLAGALRMDPEAVLTSGAGQLLGKTIEASAVENLTLAGGFAAVTGAMELVAAVAVFAAAGLAAPAICLIAWIVLAAWLSRRYLIRARAWTQARMDLTDALVERMVGHRTRLAQEAPSEWHSAEDRELSAYVEVSRLRDRAEAMLATVLPQGWVAAGVASLVGAFLSDRAGSGPVAAGLGGVLLAFGAFRKIAAAAYQLLDAWVAREQIRELLDAARRREPAGAPNHAARPPEGSAVEVRDLVYRYEGSEDAVLRRCSLRIQPGDRLVLEGESGGGKSTLAAVLAGIRAPRSGLLMAGGLDRATIGGAAWSRRVALAPQFHQNHVITGPLSFNLLLGRPLPVRERDAADALQICEELGLGPLLARMPGGLTQIVGETGWQMSQGERSRLFLARALLQGADLVILDESFGALDPETRKLAVDCAVRRAKSLLVIAHR